MGGKMRSGPADRTPARRVYSDPRPPPANSGPAAKSAQQVNHEAHHKNEADATSAVDRTAEIKAAAAKQQEKDDDEE